MNRNHRFGVPRRVSDATMVPWVNRSDGFQLIRTAGIDPDILLSHRCFEKPSGWWAPRDAELDIDALHDVLPRYAQRAIVPEIVDLIPSSSWGASLANCLLGNSWEFLRALSEQKNGGCEECGVKSKIECHERWLFDDENMIQKLGGLRSLCKACHEVQHLGFANSRGRLQEAVDRLGRINRIHENEIQGYLDAVFGNWEWRSQFEWTLDLTILKNGSLGFKRAFSLVEPGVVSGIVNGEAYIIRIIGVDIIDNGTNLVLI